MERPLDSTEIVLQGVAASPGVVIGYPLIFVQEKHTVPHFKISKEDSPNEIQRFENALIQTRNEINKLRIEVSKKLGEDEAKIFDAHLLVLEDPALIEDTINEHKKTLDNIDHSFKIISKRYIEAFDKINDDYIKERSSDIRDVTRRLLDKLLGHNTSKPCNLTTPSIIASEQLSPSDTIGLDITKILGLITDTGSRTSHTVIMARSLNVPAVVALRDVTKRIKPTDKLIIDGFEGMVIINPSEQTLFRYHQLDSEHERINKIFKQSLKQDTKTLDNQKVTLLANIEGESDVEKAVNNTATGVGLFRTESLFLKENQFPTEDDQFAVYKNVVTKSKNFPITIRTLDIGGDKRLTHYLFPLEEENPFMGFRAIRFCLEYPHIFKDQLRAILRASHFGKVSIMYPMISSITELLQANRILEEAKNELRQKNIPFDDNIPVGIMIEIPSAAATADLLAQHCSFFSIGTNDLIQYLLAVDRVNDRIAHLYEPNHPAVIRTLKAIIDAGHKQGIPVSICGEMAGDSLYTPLLLGLKIDSLSVTPSVIPEIKYYIQNSNYAEMENLAENVLKHTTSIETFHVLKKFYDNYFTKLLK